MAQKVSFRHYIVPVFFFSCLCLAWATAAQDVKIKRITVEDGLSQNTITCMLRDSQGFMWFGTQDGLNLYDGYTFKVFKNDLDDSTSISDNHIWSLLEDKNGRLWVGTLRGLNSFNIRTQTFTRYVFDKENHDLTTSVRAIVQDKTGEMWVGIDGQGLQRVDVKTKKFEPFKIARPGSSPADVMNGIRCIYQDKAGNFYVGTNTGLSYFTVSTQSYKYFKADLNDPSAVSDNNIHSILEDTNGIVWIGTRDQGLNRFDPKTGVFTKLHKKGDFNSLADDEVISLHQDKAGKIWVGTGNGLCLYNPVTQTFKTFYHDPNNDATLSDGRITAIGEDPAGRLVIGTFGAGFNLFDQQAKKFTIVTHNPTNTASLNNKNIWAICEDRKGRLWIGTDQGLNLSKPKGGFEHFMNEPGNPSSLSGNIVTAIFEDSRGRIWIGTHRNGLNLWNEQTRTFQRFKSTPQDPSSLLDNGIPIIYEASNHTIWVASSRGLNRYNDQTKTFKRYPIDPGNLWYDMTNNSLSSMTEDRSGMFWMSTDGGLCLFDSKTGTYECFKNERNNPNSLSSNFVYSILKDREGRIWACSNRGINLFNAETKSFIAFQEKHGLPDDIVYAMLEDSQGRFWMSTNRGISRLTPSATSDLFKGNPGVFRNYDESDGLQNNEFNSGAFFKGKDGRMYFGGINGFNIFHPDSIQDDTNQPPIVFTGFEIFNKPVQPGKAYGRFILPASINTVNEIILTHEESVFTIEFAALSFVKPMLNQYAHMLEGFETDWQHTDATRRTATYTNLDPGTYTFRVKGSNHDGIWNETGRSIKIIVTPPWWKSWWFKTMIIVNILLLSVLISVYRTRNIRAANLKLTQTVNEKTQELHRQNETLRQNQEEISTQHDLLAQQNQELTKQRTELATQNAELNNLNKEKSNLISIVAHDLRSPLNHIKGLLNIIRLTNPTLDQETTSNLQMIETSVGRQTELIRKILNIDAIDGKEHNIKLEPIDLSQLAQLAVDRFKIEAQQKQLTINLEKVGSSKVIADHAYTNQVMDNLLSNAIKFSPSGKQIHISITPNDQRVHFKIRDEGPGFTEEDKTKLFGKYQRLSAFPTGNETSIGLGLSIVKKYIDLMEAEIWCDSKPGHGTCFTIRFKQA
jgi:ligand-binding sensor domain-containing protein/signal transduction histidine kinase